MIRSRFCEALGYIELEDTIEPQIYCFGGGGGGGEGSGGDYSDLGDAGDTGVSDSVAAGGQGWGPDNGSNDQSSNDDQDRRVQSNGSTTNVNIDRSQSSVVADVNGTQRTVYGTQENLDNAIASGDLNPVGNVQDDYTPGTQEAAEAYSSVLEDKEDALDFDDLDAIAASFDAMDDQSITAGYRTEELQASLTPPTPQTQDELMDQLDAITEQFKQMDDAISAGQNVAITGSGQVTTVDSYNAAKEQAIQTAVNAYRNNPNIQNSTTLNPEDPENIASLESKLAEMSLDQIDTFSRDMGGLEEGQTSYNLAYNFGTPQVSDIEQRKIDLGLSPDATLADIEQALADARAKADADIVITGEYQDTFVAQNRTGAGVPVSTLPEGSYQVNPDDNTVSLNDAGKEYMDELAKGWNNLDNKYGIDRQEIESLMRQGQVVGSPMVRLDTSIAGQQGAQQGGESKAGEGEQESGMPGGMGGQGRAGSDEERQEGQKEFAYDYPVYTQDGGEFAQQEKTPSGIGIAPESGGIGVLPGKGGIVGTDSGPIGQSGSDGFNPFTEGGEGGQGSEGSTIPGQGEGDFGTGEGTGDGTGTGTPTEIADSGDGGDTPAAPVIPVDRSPYSFGDPLTYDPNLPDFDYREPLVTRPYDFMRDFGAYTLSEPIAQEYAQRALLAPEGLTPYTPEYMEPISEMDLARQEELLSLIGERFPGEYGEFDYDLMSSPIESAQALIDALGDQSS